MRKAQAARSGAVRVITAAEMESVRKQIRSSPKEPLHRRGTVTKCPRCKGRMVTTNDLEKALVVPNGLLVLSRLPGARCSDCEAQLYDAGALAIIEEHRKDEIFADYHTTVTRAAGRMLGTYFRADLVRVLGLKGKEILKWRVVGRNRVVVDIER